MAKPKKKHLQKKERREFTTKEKKRKQKILGIPLLIILHPGF